MHGSKAYLEQLACKLLIQVELLKKGVELKPTQNTIISQLKKR